MFMQSIYNNLINKLKPLLKESDLQDIKQTIDDLILINEFKYHIMKLSDDDIHNDIKNLFYKKFKIKYFKIKYSKKYQTDIKYVSYDEDNHDILLSQTYANNISIEHKIELLYEAQPLDDEKQMLFESYCEDITNILYIRYLIIELQNSSLIDPLTKLKNRLSFQEDMKELIPLALREKMNIGVLLINIDRFRAVNDEHGDKFGDKFLQLYAKTIQENIRTSDIAIRFSGGEFLILLMNVIDEAKTLEIAESLKEALSNVYLVTPNGDHFKKTICMGISMFPQDSNDMDEIIKNAELALTDAKDQGRSIILRYQEDDGELDLF